MPSITSIYVHFIPTNYAKIRVIGTGIDPDEALSGEHGTNTHQYES